MTHRCCEEELPQPCDTQYTKVNMTCGVDGFIPSKTATCIIDFDCTDDVCCVESM